MRALPLLCLAGSSFIASCTSSGETGASVPDGSNDAYSVHHADASRPGGDARAPDAGHDIGAARDTGPHDGNADGMDASYPIDARPDANAPPDATDGSPPDTCSDGAPVAYTRASCSGAPASVPAGLASAASSASLGDVLALGGLPDSTLPCFPVRVCVASGAPTLIFSDDPESPSADGVLYADMLSTGGYRAYIYHTNAGAGLRKFPIVLLNQGATTVHVTITAEGIAGPSQDYVDVGKQALLRWLMSQGGSTIVDVAAGARVLLSSALDGTQAATNELAHGIIDFSVDGPVKLSVVSVVASEDATLVTAGLSLLPNDGAHMRGSFPGAALEIESLSPVDGQGARHLRMGGNVTDAILVGHDYVDGTDVTLDGNYGVSYAMSVTFAANAPSALLLSPQGGAWGGAALVTTGPALLPASQDSLGTQTDAIAIGSFIGGAQARLTFLSAGGSSLPVDLVTVPLP